MQMEAKMKKVFAILVLLLVAAYILGQMPGDGVKVLFVASVASSGAYMVGYRSGSRDRAELVQARSERLFMVEV